MKKRRFMAAGAGRVRDVLANRAEEHISYFCVVELERALFKTIHVRPINHLKVCILINIVGS